MGPDDIKWHKNLEWTPLCSLIATVQPASTLFFKLKFTPTYCGADEDSSGSLDCWQFWGVPPSVNCQLLPFLHCILSIFPQWAVGSLLPSSCVILVFRRATLDCRFADWQEGDRAWGKPRYTWMMDMKCSLLHFQGGASAFKTLRSVLPNCCLSWPWLFICVFEWHKTNSLNVLNMVGNTAMILVTYWPSRKNVNFKPQGESHMSCLCQKH